MYLVVMMLPFEQVFKYAKGQKIQLVRHHVMACPNRVCISVMNRCRLSHIVESTLYSKSTTSPSISCFHLILI